MDAIVIARPEVCSFIDCILQVLAEFGYRTRVLWVWTDLIPVLDLLGGTPTLVLVHGPSVRGAVAPDDGLHDLVLVCHRARTRLPKGAFRLLVVRGRDRASLEGFRSYGDLIDMFMSEPFDQAVLRSLLRRLYDDPE